MLKTIKIIVLATLCLNFSIRAQAPIKPPPLKNQAILGKVSSATTAEALPNAAIKITTTNQTLISNDKGEFIVTLANGDYNLSVSYLGYKTSNIYIQIPLKEPLVITLQPDDNNLKEVEIVSTGYQSIPKERATGSFVFINNDQINQRVSTNILDRLNGATSSLLFDPRSVSNTNKAGITIRGRSTLFANDQPLIILDNFPYDGDLQNINPNDIENITILKDAAAASIWGVRAGNGVIVITSKKGKAGKKAVVELTTNLSSAPRPDQFYQKQMTSAEYIDFEQYLFDKGRFNTTINNKYAALSPAVEIMLSRRNNEISEAQKQTLLDSLGKQDIRTELNDLIYRNQTSQQYALNISGGTEQNTYYIAGGYDKNLLNQLANNYSRMTLNANNTYSLLKNKLNISTGLVYTSSKAKSNAQGYTPKYPYERIKDQYGNALPVTDGILRLAYVDTVGNGKLMDWHYRPLDEINKSDKSTTGTAYRLNLTAVVSPVSWIKVTSSYQFESGMNESENIQSANSYFVRNAVNSFSFIDPVSKTLKLPIPMGGIYDLSSSSYNSNSFREMIGIDKHFSEQHNITGIIGAEVKDYKLKSARNYRYGFNEETLTNANATIDYSKTYELYYNGNSAKIANNTTNEQAVDRYVSYFSNVTYNYKNRYTISGSVRKDQSNIFGVKSNQKGVPLWSAGALWDIQKENFLKDENWLTDLKLRLTYGYSGNVDKSISAYLTAQPSIANNPNYWNVSSFSVVNPPNPSLRWEKVSTVNYGIDFGIFENLLKGSLEYFTKAGIDLIGNSTIAPQTGITTFRGNSASTFIKGIDIRLNGTQKIGQIDWLSTLQFSTVKNKVTTYKIKPGSNAQVARSLNDTPVEGYSYQSLFAFKWLGLDTLGNPVGSLAGSPGIDYAKLLNSTDLSELLYIGSSTPTAFGNFSNTFQWHGLAFSFNISYKLGYYFRKTNVFSGTALTYKQSDYANRWQKKGDELNTNIPALQYPLNANRGSFFDLTEFLINKGDHIRLQDIRLAYTGQLKNTAINKITGSIQLNNVAMIWKANKQGLDPDYLSAFPAVQKLSISLKANF